MKMTFEYSTLHLSSSLYKKLSGKVLREALIEGATRWMNACLVIIPVWSGASHGTFLKLAAKIGQDISVASQTSMPGALGPAAGQVASTAKMTVFDNAYVLEYGTTLWHLIYNEYNNANADPEAGRLFAKLRRPGPYNFQAAGAGVFEMFAKSVRLPSPWRALKLKHKAIS